MHLNKCCWLSDWWIDWLIDWLFDWLIDWSLHALIVWLIDRSIDWLIDWLTNDDWLLLFVRRPRTTVKSRMKTVKLNPERKESSKMARWTTRRAVMKKQKIKSANIITRGSARGARSAASSIPASSTRATTTCLRAPKNPNPLRNPNNNSSKRRR